MRQLSLAGICAAVVLSSRATAQCPPPPPAAGAGTIVGTVSDTAHNPIDSMDVIILSAKRQTTTVNGTFRLDKLKPQRYDVTVRRFGYPTVTRFVTVGDSGASLSICLAALPAPLAPVISSAPRGGLSGVIADTAF